MRMGLDQIMDERVGFGKCQLRTMALMCLLSIFHGTEMVLNSFLNPIFKLTYHSSSGLVISAIASSFFMGCLFGSISGGYYADKYGRKKIIQTGAFLQMVMSLSYFIANSLVQLFFVRFLNGLALGFTLAIVSTYIVEILPQQYRAKGIILINFSAVLGKLFGVGLGYLFIKDHLPDSNWKTMVLCGTMPTILFLLLSQIIPESPLILCSHGHLQDGFVVVNQMIILNKGEEEPSLTVQQKIDIRETFQETKRLKNKISLDQLFSANSCNQIIFLGLCWIIINFCFFGQLNVEALHLAEPKVSVREGLTKYWLIVLGEAPSLLLTLLVVDHPLFARKTTLLIFFAGASIAHFIFSLSSLALVGFISRLFMKGTFLLMFPLMAQSFETRIRTRGAGFCVEIGNIGSIMMPFIVSALDDWKQASVYVCFSILNLIACLIVSSQVEQTREISLDHAKLQKRDS